MVTYSFVEGTPEALNPEFDDSLFHQARHVRLQSSEGWRTFGLRNEQYVLLAVVHFNMHGDSAVSPFRAPFGSYIFSDTVSSSQLMEFIHHTEDLLKLQGVKKIQLKNFPEIYYPVKSDMLRLALLSAGYAETEEACACIHVSDKPFESGIHASERKRIKKSNVAGLVFRSLPLDQLKSVYEFLQNCRDRKNYSLSMSYDELKKTMETFRDRFLLSSVIGNAEMAAANISIRVNHNVLYNFYHDHSEHYDSYSPVVLLNKGLYEYCQQKSLTLLDLGTSQQEGVLNESLFNFKLRLGAVASRKLTFSKNLI